ARHRGLQGRWRAAFLSQRQRPERVTLAWAPSGEPTMKKLLILAFALTVTGSAASHGQSHPYVALTDRPIKALSDDDVANLRAGRGMGMALSAELNRYPGPSHVLENDAALGLTDSQ